MCTSRHSDTLSLIIIFFCLILLLSGCGEAREINDTSIVMGYSLDWDKKNNEYSVVGEVVSRIPEMGAVSENMQKIEGKGPGISSAMADCEKNEEKQIYKSHSKIFVLDRDLAEKGIDSLIDYVIRNYDTRLSVDFLILDHGDASLVWDSVTGDTGIKSFDLEEAVITAEKNSLITRIKAYQTAEFLNRPGVSIVMPMLHIDDDNKVSLGGTGVFYGHKLIGTLDEEETRYLLFMQDRMKKCTLTLSNNILNKSGDPVTIRITKSNTDFSTHRDGQTIYMKANINVNAEIIEATSSYGNKEIEEAAEALISSECEKLVNKAVNILHSDIFGFGRIIEKRYPDIFYPLSNGWHKGSFRKLPVKVICTVKIKPL